MAKNPLGHIYLVRRDPMRIKVGGTTEATVENRFRKVRTFNPEIERVKSWPARRRWEEGAQLTVGMLDCIEPYSEDTRKVFRLRDEDALEVVNERLETWFSLLSSPEGLPEEVPETDDIEDD